MSDIITMVSGLLSIVASIISITAITQVNTMKKKYQKQIAQGKVVYQAGGNIYEKDGKEESY